MAESIIKASFLDSLRFNLSQAVPIYLQGIFTRSPFWVSFWTRFHPDPAAVKFGYRLREKYGKEVLFISVLANQTLLVLDKKAIRQVLSQSPNIYAEPKMKRNGMSHFQPNAVTISRGHEWADRRRFNEGVLDLACQNDEYRDHHLKIIQQEVAAVCEKGGQYLKWKDFEELFDRITLQIIFGQRAKEDTGLTEKLRKMMRESNRAFALRKSRHFDGFYSAIRSYLDSPEDFSLVSLCRRVPSSELTRVENQVPHWMFAMNETLSINTARALALIASHPHARQRVRDEMAGRDQRSARDVESLEYIEACVQEAMRLWPTTPWLIRETVTEATLYGCRVAAKTQVLILNNFNHRDKQSHPFADRFTPELWIDNGSNFCFNHLSNGPQVCAGKSLALFIAKGVIGALLGQGRYDLEKPLLNPNRPLPQMYNNYGLVFHRVQRA